MVPAIFRLNPAKVLTMFFLASLLTGYSNQSVFGEVRVPPLIGLMADQDSLKAERISNRNSKKNILLVVGDVKELNPSERQLMSWLKDQAYPVMLVNDKNDDPELTHNISMVIISKTVNSKNIGTRFKKVTCGFMTWEDNLQMANLMGFSENDGTEGTAWHVEGRAWHILPGGPLELNAGLSGELEIYDQPGEITYSPNGSEVPESAIVVAELYTGDYHKTYYVFEKGAVLGDGSRATGRRIYFGLYDDTFKLLTEAGLQLFTAAVEWGTDR